MATNISFTSIDFNTLKQELIDYISATTDFQDHNFEGSNLNLLINLLAYITNILSFNLNQAIGENYLGTAELRENVLKIVKLLDYVPYRKTSSTVNIDIAPLTYSDTELTNGYLLQFDSITNEASGYTFFYVGDNLEIVNTNLSDITFHEGVKVVNDTALIGDGTEYQYFIIANESVGNNLFVYTIDNGVKTYWELFQPGTLYTETSSVYFIEEVATGYKIYFGNDRLGRVVANQEVIGYTFIQPTGAEANGLNTFTWNANTGLNLPKHVVTATVTLNTNNTQSLGGSDKETIEEIKFNAPKFWNSQARAVTEDDYLAIALQHSWIEKAQIVGGENVINQDTGLPELGKVYVTVKSDLDNYPLSEFTANDLLTLKEYFLNYSVVSIDPVIRNPQFIHITITSKLRYIGDIIPSVQNTKTALYTFINTNNSNFGEYLEYTKLLTTIDDADVNTTSNITTIEKYAYINQDNFVYDSGNLVEGEYRMLLAQYLNIAYVTRIEQWDAYELINTYVPTTDYTINYKSEYDESVDKDDEADVGNAYIKMVDIDLSSSSTTVQWTISGSTATAVQNAPGGATANRIRWDIELNTGDYIIIKNSAVTEIPDGTYQITVSGYNIIIACLAGSGSYNIETAKANRLDIEEDLTPFTIPVKNISKTTGQTHKIWVTGDDISSGTVYGYPLAGTTVSWERDATVATIFAEGMFAEGDVITVSASSNVPSIANTTHTIVSVLPGQFTITCVDTGTTTGTLTFAISASMQKRIYYGLIEDALIVSDSLIVMTSGTQKNKIYKVDAVGSKVIQTGQNLNSDVTAYYFEVIDVTESNTLANLRKNDTYTVCDQAADLTGDVLVGQVIKLTSLDADIDGYYKVNNINVASSKTIYISIIEDYNDFPTFTLTDLDFSQANVLINTQYTYRLYFGTQDADMFLNNGQILVLERDENYDDIVITTEKVGS